MLNVCVSLSHVANNATYCATNNAPAALNKLLISSEQTLLLQSVEFQPRNKIIFAAFTVEQHDHDVVWSPELFHGHVIQYRPTVPSGIVSKQYRPITLNCGS